MNRLARATSPYLLQHAGNPVDWYEWGAEAFARARAEGKPIFLSIGYAACHWCHVMEREVFENARIAAAMNEHFVNIKVDREERPDVDEVYMMATQLMTGSGGWPMSVWLTPDLEPFYAGTYFPPVDGYGRPGFLRLDVALAEAWRTQRAGLLARAKEVVGHVRAFVDETERARDSQPAETLGRVDVMRWLAAAVDEWADRFDEAHGGLGGAPKFPPAAPLGVWLDLMAHERAARETELGAARLALVRRMAERTLDGMSRGGIHDQLGGGFARYSTDAAWRVPHFEKMLYDNGPLAEVFARAAAALGRTDDAQAARRICDFWLREMTGPQGGLYSTLDADSEGVEGKYYAWTLPEMTAALGEEDGRLLAQHLGATAEGNWEEGAAGANVLYVAQTVEELAAERRTDAEALRAKLNDLRERLRRVRDARPRPALDDKVLAGWNGLMISGLAVTGRLLNEPRYVEAAGRAAAFLMERHVDGAAGVESGAGVRLLRVSRGGAAHTPGFLEDYAYLLNGMLDLMESAKGTGLAERARRWAIALAEGMVSRFEDHAAGGFYFTSDEHEPLFARIKNALDGATPSANGMAVRGLLRLARATGNTAYRDVALRSARAFAGMIARQPGGFATMLRALMEDDHDESPAAFGEAAAAGAAGQAGTAGVLGLDVVRVGESQRGGALELEVAVTVRDGFYVQSHVPADPGAHATTLRLRGDLELGEQAWDFPPAQEVAPGVHGYRGRLVVRGRVGVPAAAALGRHVLRVTVLAQACREGACLMPGAVGVALALEVTG